MYGPKNIAGAFIKESLLKRMKPVLLGGGMIESQQIDDVWLENEYKFYAGTYDVGLLVAWAKACEYINSVSYLKIKNKEQTFSNHVSSVLRNYDNVTLISGEMSSKSLLAFVHSKIHPHDIENFLAKKNVIIRAGNMCAQNAIRKIGFYAINRISFGLTVTDEDIDALCNALKECFEGLER